MDIEKFTSMILSLQGELTILHSFYLEDIILRARLMQILEGGSKLLPDHRPFFESLLDSFEGIIPTKIPTKEALSVCNYTFELINLEKSSEKKIEEKKLFQSAKDKLKESGKSFEKEDWDSVLNNLNSAIELALKEKLNIPTTI